MMDESTGWTFMGGCMLDQPCPATYACGTTASPSSVTLSAFTFHIGTNSLYHYGGYINAATPHSQDFWKYNVDERQWIHLNTGPPTDPRRFGSCMVINSIGTMLYIYGGVYQGVTGRIVKADFWGFNLTSSTWVEFNSSFSVLDGSAPLIYGIGHIGHPGARSDMSCWWSTDRFWMFGGGNRDGANFQNSLWYYDFDKFTWILTAASSDLNPETWGFGNKNVASGGIPHKRVLVGSFIDSDENMYLFGGFGGEETQFKSLADFWKIVPSPKDALIGNTTTCGGIRNGSPNVCKGRGSCRARNDCVCIAGYGGDNCELYLCVGQFDHKLGCNSGKCIGVDQCSCKKNSFIGTRCEFPICYGLPANDSSVCSNMRGQCISPNNCSCGSYGGQQCELNSCFGKYSSHPTVCNGQGTCYDTNKCECKIGYYGNDAESCSKWTCDKIEHSKSGVVCGGRGNCTDYNTCVCSDVDYTGSACELAICYGVNSMSNSVCSGGGKCTSPNNCTCHEKTGGKNCQVATNDYMIQHTFAVLLWVISGIGFVFLLPTFITDIVFLISLLRTIEIRIKAPKTNTEYQYVKDLNKPLLDEFK